MERTAVQSREIAIVGYDPSSKTLEVTFRRGGVYHYFDVPETTKEGFLSSPSLGIFFSDHIKSRFEYEKVS